MCGHCDCRVYCRTTGSSIAWWFLCRLRRVHIRSISRRRRRWSNKSTPCTFGYITNPLVSSLEIRRTNLSSFLIVNRGRYRPITKTTSSLRGGSADVLTLGTIPLRALGAALACATLSVGAARACDDLADKLLSSYLAPAIQSLGCSELGKAGVDKADHKLENICYTSNGPTSAVEIVASLHCHTGKAVRDGPGCLNRFSASISGASAGVRLPSGKAAARSRRDQVSFRQGSNVDVGHCKSLGSGQSKRERR